MARNGNGGCTKSVSFSEAFWGWCRVVMLRFGGLVASVLFVLPGFVSILALSVLYAGYHDLGLVQGIFYGLKPAVVAVVIEAVIRIGKRSLKNRVMVLLLAMFRFKVGIIPTLGATAIVSLVCFVIPGT